MARSRTVVNGTPIRLTRPQILAIGAGPSTSMSGCRGARGRSSAPRGLGSTTVLRAALLSIHARVTGTKPTALDDPALVQVWGPRYSAYVVAAGDHAPFTLGRLPDDERGRRRAEDMAARLHFHLDGRTLTDRELARGVGVGNDMRYATTTGTLLIRWEGARAPTVWSVPRPALKPLAARLELARRYVHVFGPTKVDAFATWAGEIVATWRRAYAVVDVEAWKRLSPGDRRAVEAEAASLPLPGLKGDIVVRWGA